MPQHVDGVVVAQVSAFPPPFQDTPYLLHLGLACFDRAFLAQYCEMPPTPLMVGRPCCGGLALGELVLCWPQ